MKYSRKLRIHGTSTTIVFPPELLKFLGWEVGNEIEIIDNNDKTLTLKKMDTDNDTNTNTTEQM